IHPGVYQAQDQLRGGRISRRSFLRLATLLGVSVPTAYALAACAAPATSVPATAAVAATALPAATTAATALPAATTAPAAGAIKRGGILRVANNVNVSNDPAVYQWVGPDANITRFVNEYLTETDNKNITHPYLL